MGVYHDSYIKSRIETQHTDFEEYKKQGAEAYWKSSTLSILSGLLNLETIIDENTTCTAEEKAYILDEFLRQEEAKQRDIIFAAVMDKHEEDNAIRESSVISKIFTSSMEIIFNFIAPALALASIPKGCESIFSYYLGFGASVKAIGLIVGIILTAFAILHTFRYVEHERAMDYYRAEAKKAEKLWVNAENNLNYALKLMTHEQREFFQKGRL